MIKNLLVVATAITVLLFAKATFAFERIAGASATMSATQEPTASVESAEYMAKRKAIITMLKRNNSPLVFSVDAFMKACITYKLDCYLLPAITGLESSFGLYTQPNSYNPFGWGGGYIMFKNWDEAIATVGGGLRNNYIDKGAQDVYQIGRIYAASPTWAARVERFMGEFKKVEQQDPLQSRQLALEL